MIGQHDAELAAATAEMLRALPTEAQSEMLRLTAQHMRADLMHLRADLSGREIDARVRAHVDAVRALLGEARQ